MSQCLLNISLAEKSSIGKYYILCKFSNIYSFLPISCCLLTHSSSYEQVSSLISFLFFALLEIILAGCQVSNALQRSAMLNGVC